MTIRADQIILGNDPAMNRWLLDRFGIDVTKTYITNGLTFTISRDQALAMHVEIYVGADDLRAFPDPTMIPPPVIAQASHRTRTWWRLRQLWHRYRIRRG